MELSPKLQKIVREQQLDEVTGEIIYTHLANRARKKSPENAKILRQMAKEEKGHAAFWQEYTGEAVKPNRLKIWWYKLLSYVFGYTFVLKLMEKGEATAANDYRLLSEAIPEAAEYALEEDAHEEALIDMLKEERLEYVGAMVLGLNDALVELTGTIAGLTFALAHTRMVALSGIITGISATLSMAASNYLAEKADGNENAFKSSLYTGIAYLITVVIMVLPYLLLGNEMYLWAFGIMLVSVIAIIFVFNYYISVAKGYNFKHRFFEMAGISLSVALIAFVIGIVAKEVLGVDVG
ncbi:MAG: VIT1/CCC1 transporter family protein [Christensenellaceae bacterium]